MARVRVTRIDSAEAVGKRLGELRRSRGLTLRELAFPGCTAAYLSSIEHGRRVPSLQVLDVLSQKLGASRRYLATGEEGSVDAYSTEAELALRLGDLDRAEELYSGLLQEEEPIRVRSLGGLGVCRLQKGDLAAGIDLLEEALRLGRDRFILDPTLVEALGRAYATRSEYESAVALFDEARTRAAERGDRPLSLKFTILLANTYIDLGDTIHSTDALADALADAVELGDPRLRTNVLWAQARLHTVEGRHDLAAEFAQRALEILRVSEDDRAVAFAQQLLAYIELQRGDAERALELLDNAAPTIERVGEVIEQAVFQLERARALAALSRDEEARNLLIEVGPVMRDGPRGDGARYFVLLAELYDRLGGHEDALEMYDLAIGRLSDHRSPHLVRAYRMKSALLERLGRPDEALTALRTAVSIQDETGQEALHNFKFDAS